MFDPETRLELLSWDELQPAADTAFSVFSLQPELRWAEEAWDILTAAGLTAYDNVLDYGRVCCRFFSLAGLYLDFCYRAFEEHVEPDYAEWAALLNLHPFYIGQLAGPDDDFSGSDGEPILSDALRMLADAERETVYDALLAHYGNVSALFAALWRTREQSRFFLDDEEDEDWRESDWEILNDVTAAKSDAFMWLNDGCTPILPL